MGLFTDIYNTVAKFFRPQEGQVGGDPSKSVATNRLKLVLMQDRTNLTPKVLEQMRGEMIELLSKYLEMDKDLLELNFEQEGDQVALMLSIPVIRAKDEDEIEAALNMGVESEEVDDELDFEADENEEILEDFQGEDSEQEEKPKRRARKKKEVSTPEGLDENHSQEDCADEEVHCENCEG